MLELPIFGFQNEDGLGGLRGLQGGWELSLVVPGLWDSEIGCGSSTAWHVLLDSVGKHYPEQL